MERGNYAASASSSPFNDGVPPSSGFPTVFICAISLLLFQGRSIKIQGRFDPLSEADVLSIIMRRFVVGANEMQQQPQPRIFR